MAVKASGSITLAASVDIASTWRYYLLRGATLSVPSLDDKTVRPPSTSGIQWSKVEPSYSEDDTNCLYFVDCTVYSDGSLSYSDVSKSSSYEAAKAAYNKAQSASDTASAAKDSIDNLEVGGRNYLATNKCRAITNNGITFTPNGDGGILIGGTNNTPSGYGTPYLFPTGETSDDAYYSLLAGTYILSISGSEHYANMLTDTTKFYYRLKRDTLYGTNIPYTWVGNAIIFTLTEDVEKVYIGFGFYAHAEIVDGVVYFKLEKGNKPTDWTPAPEDVEEEIGDIGDSVIRLESSIEQTAGAVVIEALSDYVRNEDVENEDGTVTKGFNSIIEALRAAITAAEGRVTTEVANRTTANDGIQQQITEIRNRMDFDKSGLIFKSFVDGVESPYRIKITNDEMIFYNGATEVQRFDAQGNAKIPSLVVDNSMRLGGFALTTDSSGNLNLDWIGGN